MGERSANKTDTIPTENPDSRIPMVQPARDWLRDPLAGFMHVKVKVGSERQFLLDVRCVLRGPVGRLVLVGRPESVAHNGLVGGSSPSRPTTHSDTNRLFQVSDE